MSFFTRSLGLAASLLLAAPVPGLAAPVTPGSPATDALLGNLVPNVDFLDRSSRLALKNSKSRKIKDFAFAQARQQTIAANALYDWSQGIANPKIAAATLMALDNAPTGSTKPTPLPATPAPQKPAAIADDRLPRGQEDLDSLEGLTGRDFDADFKDKQKDALAQVETDYATYLAKGDDAVLLALAKGELPKVRKRLAALAKL